MLSMSRKYARTMSRTRWWKDTNITFLLYHAAKLRTGRHNLCKIRLAKMTSWNHRTLSLIMILNYTDINVIDPGTSHTALRLLVFFNSSHIFKRASFAGRVVSQIWWVRQSRLATKSTLFRRLLFVTVSFHRTLRFVPSWLYRQTRTCVHFCRKYLGCAYHCEICVLPPWSSCKFRLSTWLILLGFSPFLCVELRLLCLLVWFRVLKEFRLTDTESVRVEQTMRMSGVGAHLMMAERWAITFSRTKPSITRRNPAPIWKSYWKTSIWTVCQICKHVKIPT